MRVCLVGFMASGKSTVGPLLADRLGCRFVDLDDVVVARTGRTPADWIRAEGQDAFRAVESQALEVVLARKERQVVACGGGAVVRPANIAAMKAASTVVWLRASLESCLSRARQGADRPLLGDGATAAALLRQREPLYAQAHLIVDTDGRPPADVAERIADLLEEAS